MARTDILVINAHENGGGAEVVYREMVARLAREHAVSTLSGGASSRPGHVRLPSRRGSQALWTLLSPALGAVSFGAVLATLASRRPRVAVVHNLWPTVGLGGLAALALWRRLAGMRCVLVAHDFQYVCADSMLYDFSAAAPCRECLGRRVKAGPLRRSCDKGGRLASVAKAARLLLARGPLAPPRVFDATIAPSRTLADAYVADGFAPGSVTVIPNGLPPIGMTELARTDTVLFAGRLEPEKGADLLPGIAAELARIAPGTKLCILGTGGLAGELQADVARRGLGGTAVFLGSVPRDEVLRWARQSRVFLFPSRWSENCPLSLAEAVACGLVPVVAEGCDAAFELLDRVGVTPLRALPEAAALAGACAAALRRGPDAEAPRRVAIAHDSARAGALADAVILGDPAMGTTPGGAVGVAGR